LGIRVIHRALRREKALILGDPLTGYQYPMGESGVAALSVKTEPASHDPLIL
jgi:hypothetical protein